MASRHLGAHESTLLEGAPAFRLDRCSYNPHMCVIFQPLAECRARAVELRFRRSGRDAELRSDLLMSEAFDVMQEKHDARARSELSDRRFEIDAISIARRRERDLIQREVDVSAAPSLLFPQHIERDSDKPRRERRGPAEVAKLERRTQPGLLHRILGVARRVCHPAGDTEQAWRVSMIQLPERRLRSRGQHGAHQTLVCWGTFLCLDASCRHAGEWLDQVKRLKSGG